MLQRLKNFSLWILKKKKKQNQYKNTIDRVSWVLKETVSMGAQDLCQLHNFQWEKKKLYNQFSICIYTFIEIIQREEIIIVNISVYEEKRV